MDKLTAMRTFVRVVESGSFSAVANETHTTQSAISKQVAALEQALGAKLLVRTTRSLAMTDDGARYFEQARRLVAEIAEAEAALITGQGQLRGWLRVAASVAFGRLKLMPLVRSFMANHPDVRVDLRLHDGFIGLIEQGIDVSVRIGELPDSGLIARRVGTSHRLLVAHRRYADNLPAGLALPAAPEALVQHECIVYTGLSTNNVWSFTAEPTTDGTAAHVSASESASASVSRSKSRPTSASPSTPAPTSTPAPAPQKTVRVEGHLQTNSSEVVRSAVLDGMGIAYAPTWLFEAELASGEVVPLMPGWRCPSSPIHLVSPPERRHSAKVQAFVQHLAAHLD